MSVSLGKGRRKQISSTYTDEISHIVNRIAPQVNTASFVIFKTANIVYCMRVSSFVFKIMYLEQQRLHVAFLFLSACLEKKEPSIEWVILSSLILPGTWLHDAFEYPDLQILKSLT